MKLLTAFLCCLYLWGCTAKSGTDQRFDDSQKLAAPTVSVSLSDPNSFSFAMVGDLHVSNQDASRLSRILTAAQGEGDSFIVLLGDLADQGSSQDFSAINAALTTAGWSNKFLPVVGNHDVFNDGWTNYKGLFGASHYSVTIGNSRFIVLDTGDGNVGKEQGDWLTNQLQQGGTTHTFLISHYLPVVPGERTYLRLSDEREAVHLMKEATNHHVHGWFGGHYHSYCNANIDGIDYVVAGGGGGRRMEPVTDFFFVQVTVSGSTVTYTLHTVN